MSDGKIVPSVFVGKHFVMYEYTNCNAEFAAGFCSGLIFDLNFQQA